MATEGFTIDMGFNPVLNVEKLNVILNHVKTAMGALGSDIKQIDASKLSADMKKFDTELVQAGKHTDGLKKGFKETETSLSKLKSSIGQGLSIAIGMSGLDLVKNGLVSVVKSGMDYQKSLTDMGALTGVTGGALDALGSKARGLSKEFGGTAVSQINSMKGVLSRFGPDVAKTPEALAQITKAINVLGEASGMDAATSMDALTNSMLQFGVDVSNPAELAKESARFINVLGASAKEGAAEIPQVSEAIVNAGVACQQANVSFEAANAALQVLAAGGKVGAEAGIGLRNVLSKIGSVELMTPDAIKGLQAGGVNMEILTNKALPLQTRLKELQKVQNDGSTIAKVFGIENASSANILVSNADKIGEWTKKMTGTNTAFEQAKVNSATLSAQWERLKAKVSDLAVGGFGVLKPVISGAMSVMSAMAGNITLLLVPLGLLGTAILVYKANAIKAAGVQLVKNFSDMAKDAEKFSLAVLKKVVPGLITQTAATEAGTAAQLKFNAAALINPFTMIIAGAAVLIGTLYLLNKAYNKSSEEKIKEYNQDIKGIKADEQTLEKKKKLEESNLKLVESFKKQGASALDNKKLMLKLAEAYPGVIDRTKSFETNLTNLQKAASQSNSEISNLNREINSLQSKELHIKVLISKEELKKSSDEAKLEQIKSLDDMNAVQRAYLLKQGIGLADFYFHEKKLREMAQKGDIKAMDEYVYNFKLKIRNLDNSKLKMDQGKFLEFTREYVDNLEKINKNAKNSMNKTNEFKANEISSYYETYYEEAKKQVGKGEEELEKAQNIAAQKTADALKKNNNYKMLTAKRVLEIIQNEQNKANTVDVTTPEIKTPGAPKPPEAPKGPSAYEKALKDYEKLNGEKELAVKMAETDKQLTDAKTNRIYTELELEKQSLETQIQKTAELKRQLDYFNSNVLKTAKTDDEKTAAQKLINDLNLAIKSSTVEEARINAKIVIDEKKSAEEIKKATDDLARGELELSIKMGLKPEITLVEFDRAALQEKLDNLTQKLTETTDETQRIKIQTDIQLTKGQIYDEDQKIADANEQIRLNNIKDSSKRERETRISEAKKTLRQQFLDAKGNIDLEIQARNEYYQKLAEAEKNFSAAQRTNILGLSLPLNQIAMSFGASLNSAFANLSFSTGDSQKTTELNDQKNKLKQEEDALFESLRKREISQREYYDKLTDLQTQQKELTKQIADEQVSMWKQIGAGMASALQQTGMQGLDASLVKYQDNSVKILAIDKEIEANKQNASLSETERAARELELTNQRTKAAQDSNVMIGEAYTNMGLVAAGALAELAINGKTSLKSIALVALNALQSMVPIWSAQILAGSLATPQSIATAGGAGLLQFTLLSGLMMAGVQLAKAAVNKFFFKGGPTPKGNPYDVGGIVHKNEFVFDHIMTGLYGKDYEIMHKEKLSPIDYVKKYDPEVLRSMSENTGRKKDQELIQVLTRQNQILEYDNKETRKLLLENIEETKNLKATFSHKTATHVTGSFDIEGDKFRANIEKAKQVSLARG